MTGSVCLGGLGNMLGLLGQWRSPDFFWGVTIKMRTILRVACVTCLVVWPVMADHIIIAVTGPADLSPGFAVDASDAVAAAFYLPKAYSGVGIDVTFQDLGFGGSYVAYLTNSIGVGTTELANTIAPTVNFTMSPFGAGVQRLWTNIVLQPGNVYLILGSLDPNASGGWSTSATPTVTVDPGVIQGDIYGQLQFWIANDSSVQLDAYLPASNFAIDDLSNGAFLFQVATPEPSTSLLLGGALMALGLWRRRSG